MNQTRKESSPCLWIWLIFPPFTRYWKCIPRQSSVVVSRTFLTRTPCVTLTFSTVRYFWSNDFVLHISWSLWKSVVCKEIYNKCIIFHYIFNDTDNFFLNHKKKSIMASFIQLWIQIITNACVIIKKLSLPTVVNNLKNAVHSIENLWIDSEFSSSNHSDFLIKLMSNMEVNRINFTGKISKYLYQR